MEKELKLFFDDHYRHFNCYPLEFEYNGNVYDFNQCIEILNKLEAIQ